MADDCCHNPPDTKAGSPPINRQPFLYASIRLTCLVDRVKERLRCRTQKCIQLTEDVKITKSSLQAQAQRDWYRWNEFIHRDLPGPAGVTAMEVHPKFPKLRTQLDQYVSHTELKTATVTVQDHLFLAYNAKAMTRFRAVGELRRMYNFTMLLLARLSWFSTSVFRDYRPWKSYATACGSVNEKGSIANVDRVLRCLRHAVLESLIYHGLRSLEEDIQRWHQHWLRARRLTLDWFSEWPGGRRPLSTTWPWNIKPSLVVLWGVCWMFYDNSTRSAQELRQQLENEEGASSVWERHPPQPATSSQQDVIRWVTDSSGTTFQHPAWLQTGSGGVVNARHTIPTPEYSTTTLPGYQSSHPTAFSPYISSYPVAPPDPNSDPSLIWHQNQGSYSLPVLSRNPGNSSLQTAPPAHRHSAPSSLTTFSPDYTVWQEPFAHQHQHSQQQPQRSVFDPPRIASSVSDPSYAPFLQQANSQRDNRAAAAFPQGLQLPMGYVQTYPSPHSDVSKDERRSSTYSFLPNNDMSPKMVLAASPSAQSQPSPSSVGKKGEEPPRDASGQITCSHPKCANQPPVFSRRCEWTKHMDKHTRPYVCNLPGCEKVRGFTYSGGLSRHQREVHRQYGSQKAAYMCPHRDCKRSTGAGFSRRENLQEHLRRVHRQVGDPEVPKQVTTEAPSPATTEPRRRRRRDDDEDNEEAESVLPEPRKRRRNDDVVVNKEDTSEDSQSRDDLSAQVKRLRKELREKDERLRKLEHTVELLTRKLT